MAEPDEPQSDDTAPLSAEEIKGALSRAQCVCGHLLQEHGPAWCHALACDCRTYRTAESAS
jgi:hypothetical protein